MDLASVPAARCPEEYVCSISLDVMVNPVKLRQTGQIYDHSSFHEWLTQGGSICPMTATRLRNPIVLQPQTQLRNEIWEYQRRQAELQQTRQKLVEEPCDTVSEDSCDSWTGDILDVNARIENRREQDIQHRLAAERIPDVPADPGVPFYKAIASWFNARGRSAPKLRPSTYFVSGGNHVYSRGDLD